MVFDSFYLFDSRFDRSPKFAGVKKGKNWNFLCSNVSFCNPHTEETQLVLNFFKVAIHFSPRIQVSGHSSRVSMGSLLLVNGYSLENYYSYDLSFCVIRKSTYEIDAHLFLTKTTNWVSIFFEMLLVYMHDKIISQLVKILNSTAALE